MRVRQVKGRIPPRANPAQFLTIPKRKTDSAPRMDPGRSQNPGGLQQDRNVDRVVGRSCAAVPRVEMCARDHDFILLVRAGNLRQQIRGAAAIKLSPKIGLDQDGNPVLYEPDDSVVMLRRQIECGRRWSRNDRGRGWRAHGQCAAFTRRGSNDAQHSFLLQELVQIGKSGQCLFETRRVLRRGSSRRGSRRWAGHLGRYRFRRRG